MQRVCPVLLFASGVLELDDKLDLVCKASASEAPS